jgi:hypothetical protein
VAETLDLVAIIAGGLTTLGVVLDWGVTPETKQRIQTRLEGLLYRFRYTTPRTFGRDEIEFSMRVLHLFGERFFSWRRLVFVVLTYATICAAILLLEHVQRLQVYGFQLRIAEAFILTFSAIAFSLSISYTLWLCHLMLRIPYGSSFLGTIVLLMLHLFLLIAWRAILRFITNTLYTWLLDGPDLDSAFFVLGVDIGDYERMFAHGLWDGVRSAFFSLYLGSLYALTGKLTPGLLPFSFLYAAESAAALFANAFRISLALIFVSGFFYVRTVRPVLIWFWSALTRSPVLFSPPLSALAAIILAVDRREAIIGALTRPFH